MHIQIIHFQLKGLEDAGYRKLCNELAPAFADVPGLVSKVWLASPDTNTYGGVYSWKDREAMEAFQRTELFKNVATHPNLANISSTDFSILDGPTRLTRGFEEVA